MSEVKKPNQIISEEANLNAMLKMLEAPPVVPTPMIRMKHISHLDLDGYGCTILTEMLASFYPEGSFDLELSHILPNKLFTELQDTLDNGDKYNKIVITDLAVSQAVVDLVNASEHKDKVRIFDHHDCVVKDLPDNIIVSTKSPIHEGKLTCATELYYNFIINDDAYGLILEEENRLSIGYFVEVVRVYDTFEFWKNKNDTSREILTSYHDAPRLNILFHIMERLEFSEYIILYMKTMRYDTLLTENSTFPWIPKVLEMEFNKNTKYIESAIKRLVKSPMNYVVYKNNEIHKINYFIGIIYAEKSSPVIANTALDRHSDIDLCAVISNNQVSLYSNRPNVNVAHIAKLFNGGGHAEAAGFTIPYVNAAIFNADHFNAIVRCAANLPVVQVENSN